MGDGDPVCRPRRRPQKSHLRARATAARAIECQRPSGRPPHGGRDDSTSTGAVHPRYPLHGRGGGRRARAALDGPRALCRRYLGGLVPRALCEYMRPSTVAPWVSYTVPARLLNDPALTPHSSSTITRSHSSCSCSHASAARSSLTPRASGIWGPCSWDLTGTGGWRSRLGKGRRRRGAEVGRGQSGASG